jgi:hypothetical protein
MASKQIQCINLNLQNTFKNALGLQTDTVESCVFQISKIIKIEFIYIKFL